jgi:hypothetical protein
MRVEKLDFRESAALLTDGRSVVQLTQLVKTQLALPSSVVNVCLTWARRNIIALRVCRDLIPHGSERRPETEKRSSRKNCKLLYLR